MPEKHHLFAIIATIVVAGVAGGYAGHLAVLFPEPKTASIEKAWSAAVTATLVDIFIGVVAAFCVPAVISWTAPDNVVTKILSSNTSLCTNLLYLAGYCIIASYSARTFLQSILNQIKTSE